MVTDDFKIPSISCDGCAKAIRTGLAPLHAVSQIEVDIPAKLLSVTHTVEVSRDQIKETLADIGYDAED